MNEREMLIYSGVGLVALGYFVVTIRNAAQNPERPPEPPPVAVETVEFCGDVVKQCTISAQIKTKPCDTGSLQQKVEEALRSPLSLDPCKQAEQELSAGCPTNCEIDFSSLLVVPGILKFHSNTSPDEFGDCFASGSKVVSIRGSCRQKS